MTDEKTNYIRERLDHLTAISSPTSTHDITTRKALAQLDKLEAAVEQAREALAQAGPALAVHSIVCAHDAAQGRLPDVNEAQSEKLAAFAAACSDAIATIDALREGGK